jgi:hypothetical protein
MNETQQNHGRDFPYSGGWPTWPFTRLSDHDMEQFLGQLSSPKRGLSEELVEDVGEALL